MIRSCYCLLIGLMTASNCFASDHESLSSGSDIPYGRSPIRTNSLKGVIPGLSSSSEQEEKKPLRPSRQRGSRTQATSAKSPPTSEDLSILSGKSLNSSTNRSLYKLSLQWMTCSDVERRLVRKEQITSWAWPKEEGNYSIQRGLDVFPKLKYLNHLTLRGITPLEMLIKGLSQLQNLTYLDWSEISSNDEDFSTKLAFSIGKLAIRSMRLEDIGETCSLQLKAFEPNVRTGHFKALKELSLNRSWLRPATLCTLPLTSLNLRGTKVSSNNSQLGDGFHKMIQVDDKGQKTEIVSMIQDTAANQNDAVLLFYDYKGELETKPDAHWFHKIAIDTLSELDLCALGLKDLQLKFLLGMKNLRHLYLGENPITALCLDILNKLPNLRCLILSDTNITDRDYYEEKPLSYEDVTLSFPTTLTRLTLSRTQYYGDAIKNLLTMESLTELRLNDTKLTDAARLAITMRKNKKLRVVAEDSSTPPSSSGEGISSSKNTPVEELK